MILGVPFESVQGHQALSRVDGEISAFGIVARPTRFPVEFQCESGHLLSCNGNVRIAFQTKQETRPLSRDEEGKRAQNEVCPGTRYSSQVGMHMSGNFLNCIKVSSTNSNFKRVRGISFEMLQWERASSHFEGRILWFSSRFHRKFGVPHRLQRGPHGPARIASVKSGLISRCDGHFWIPRNSLYGK